MGLTGVLAIVLVIWLVVRCGFKHAMYIREALPHQTSKSSVGDRGREVLTPMSHALSVISMRRTVL
jgi:hypothetical protein